MNEQNIPATHRELLGVAEQTRARWQVPGLALGIMVGRTTFSSGLGVNALDTRHAVRPDTLFQVGSISKPFAATLAMSLVDDQVLDLDTPVIAYLPDLQLKDMRAAGAITPRQLLVHTGGFWGDWFADRGLGDDALHRFVAEYGALHQLTAPGELWAYNNCGYILLGRLCEVLTGQTYEQALRERVLAPLGLEHTFLFAHEAITYPLAVGHNQEGDDAEVVIARQFLRPRARNAAGGVIASVDDIVRFGSFHLGAHTCDDTLSDATRVLMQQPLVPSVAEGEFWGLGWRVTGEGSTRTFGHGGATNGFRASLTVAPERGFVLAVLTNSSRGSAAAHEISEWALQHYCQIKPAAPTFIDLPAERLATLVGRYEQPYSTIEVEPQPAAGIRLQHVSESPYYETHQPPPRVDHARPISDHEFVVTGGEFKDSHLRFVYDAAGDVRFLQVGGRLHTPVAG